MAPTEPPPAAPKLPASADFNALYNRISLASAKQATFLSSMRAKYPSLARASSASTANTSTTNGAFSSLSRPSTQQPTASSSSAATRAADDSDLRFENPNTGVGYAAPKSEEAASAATRDLSRRLLGKRGRGVEDVGAAQRRRAALEEESEEEEGRSGLGRKKKKRARIDDDDDEEGENAVHPAADVQMREGEDEAKPDDVIEAAPLAGQQDPGEIARDNAVTSRDGQPETGEAKKKKKKKNKGKKKTKIADGVGDA